LADRAAKRFNGFSAASKAAEAPCRRGITGLNPGAIESKIRRNDFENTP
jgi:hypothetical protein